jgi:hypothetical protein
VAAGVAAEVAAGVAAGVEAVAVGVAVVSVSVPAAAGGSDMRPFNFLRHPSFALSSHNTLSESHGHGSRAWPGTRYSARFSATQHSANTDSQVLSEHLQLPLTIAIPSAAGIRRHLPHSSHMTQLVIDAGGLSPAPPSTVAVEGEMDEGDGGKPP